MRFSRVTQEEAIFIKSGAPVIFYTDCKIYNQGVPSINAGVSVTKTIKQIESRF
jgi:hypothetical protein